MDRIGETVTWKNREWEDGHTGIILAVVSPGTDIRGAILSCGAKTIPFEIAQDGFHLKGSRYAKIGGLASVNERYLIEVEGRHLYAPRKTTVDSQNPRHE